MITFEEVSELLSYDKETGLLYWRKDSYIGFKKSVLSHKKGGLAKTFRKDGRGVVRLNGRLYLSYRIAWLLETGKWPDGEIDHKNGNSSDDSFKNLRDVSRATNQENLINPFKSKKSSLFIGVYANKKGRSKPWKSAITVNGKQISLGAFNTEEEAYAAYVSAKRILHLGCTI